MLPPRFSLDDTLAKLADAVASRSVTEGARVNIQKWLVEPRYADYADAVAPTHSR